MPITSWTSEDMDWSDADSIRLQSVANIFEAIRLAVRERQLAAGLTPSGHFVESYDLHLLPAKTFADAVQSAITDLIPRYVNHADSGGDWDGLPLASFAPAWTAAGLLDAIEAETRLAPDNLSSIGAWAFQQYQILNMLRWLKISEPRWLEYAIKRADNLTDWGSTLALFNSLDYPSSESSYYSIACSSVYSSGRYAIWSSHGKFSASSSWMGQADMDCYILPVAETSLDFAFFDGDMGLVQNVMNLIASPSSLSGPAFVNPEFTDFAPPPDPTSQKYECTDFPSSFVTNNRAIIKPSFAFKDW